MHLALVLAAFIAQGAPDGGTDAKSYPPSTVTEKQLKVSGGLSKDAVAKVVRAHQAQLQYCYEQALARTPGVAGNVSLAFTIDSAGIVSVTRIVGSTLHNQNAELCMLQRTRLWGFPRAKSLVTVIGTWAFAPRK